MPSPSLAAPRIPTATYRVQMHHGFTFNQALDIIAYLHDLGISDLYTSPFFQAAPGSTHGYDIVDHNHLNVEIGTEEEFDALVAEIQRHDMGLLADFVPNHMGIGQTTNGWWMDVLENGPSSLTARCFDINWHPLKAELENKVLLPILGEQYGRVLENGELTVSFEGGTFYLHYYDTKLPINPRTYNQVLQFALDALKSGREPGVEVVAPIGVTSHHEGDQPISELQSIMTQLEKMPSRNTTDQHLIAERAREKEVAKVRLETLCTDHPPVAAAIEAALENFHGRAEDKHSFDNLDRLIDAQAYRLSYWRVAAEEINYRRFFDINQLAAIRVELPEVFEATHQLLWRLLEKGAVTGLRIDHPDGLFDPRGYFTALQQNFARLRGTALPEDGKGIYLLAEKILSGNEELREDWPIHGTTGYDFTTHVTQLLVNAGAAKSFSETYEKFIGRHVHFPSLIYAKKRLTMRLSLANDINVLGFMLNRLSESNRRFRDFTLNALTAAVREIVASFPVYRTYLVPGQPPSAADIAVVNRATVLAKRTNPGTDASIYDFLRDILLFRFSADMEPALVAQHEQFVMKFQQCTGPIMAKGLEDTAFYIYNRLVALNEVGGEPQRFGISAQEFHHTNEHNRSHWPHTMLASSTHDTKRSEDTRARIAALSELPQEWRRAVRAWSSTNAKQKSAIEGEQSTAPDPNEELLLYQVLLGTWPMQQKDGGSGEAQAAVGAVQSAFGALSPAEHAEYVARIQDYMTKAIKEAKVNSSWVQANDAWDEAVRKFVATLLRRGKRVNPFVRALEPLAERVAQLGMYNSLTQLVLKLTVPGVPDIYQGNELWDYSLVDPDNRRAVDFKLRKKMLAALEGAKPKKLLRHWPDGRIKLFVTRALLRLRAEQPELFAHGSYRALQVAGRCAENVVAFGREHEGRSVLVVVPRLTSQVGEPPVGAAWDDTEVVLDDQDAGAWRELFTGQEFPVAGEGLSLAKLFADFPWAVLTRA